MIQSPFCSNTAVKSFRRVHLDDRLPSSDAACVTKLKGEVEENRSWDHSHKPMDGDAADAFASLPLRRCQERLIAWLHGTIQVHDPIPSRFLLDQHQRVARAANCAIRGRHLQRHCLTDAKHGSLLGLQLHHGSTCDAAREHDRDDEATPSRSAWRYTRARADDE